MAGWITSPASGIDKPAIAVCSAAGIDLLGQRRIKLAQLKQALQQSLAEIRRSSKREEMLSQGLLAAGLIKATCEAFLEMAGALGSAAGIEGADFAGKAGNAAIAFAGSASSSLAGQKTDWIATSNKVAGAAISGGMNDGSMKDLAELQTIKVDIVNSAVQGRTVEALQNAFLGYIPKIGEMSLKYMKRETAARWSSAATAVANAGYNYSKALGEVFDTRIDDAVEIAERKNSMLATAHRQIGQVTREIERIDQIMNACAQAVPLGRLA